ncbi:MAG TPA: MaoC family dehydratase N-terminal domain-containing protein, partial [Actinomycetota bacterium]|nr:MaoC family dehydratase N-terminal domain-containing protein [Actinomycetota bacterium]
RPVGRRPHPVPLNRSREGASYPSVTFVVEQAAVERFALAVGDPGGGIPPTFLTVPEIAAGLSRAIADEELGLDLSRVLHGEQEYEWHRPLQVGESLAATSRIASIQGRGDLELLTIATEFVDASRERVASARSVMIVRGGS